MKNTMDPQNLYSSLTEGLASPYNMATLEELIQRTAKYVIRKLEFEAGQLGDDEILYGIALELQEEFDVEFDEDEFE